MKTSRFYRVLKVILRVIFMPVFRVKVIGAEKFCPEEGCLVYSNHFSNWDPFFMHLATKYRPRFMAKSELFKNGFVRRIVTYFGAFPVERGKGDFGALKNAFSVIEEGEIVGIYPEGKRSRDGEIKRFHSGAAVIAVRTGAKAYPLYISRQFKPFRKTYMVFGDPVDLSERFDDIKLSQNESMREATEYLRDQVLKIKSEAGV